ATVEADGLALAVADLHVHFRSPPDEDAASETPAGWNGGRDTEGAVVVLHECFGESVGDDSDLFDVELAVLIGCAEMRETADEVLAGFGDLEERGCDLIAEMQARGLDGIEAPVGDLLGW